MNIEGSFTVGDLYSSDEIQKLLQVGNAGGVRVCTAPDRTVRRVAVLTTFLDNKLVAENPYHDRIEGQVLVYTGAGRAGDQALAGVTARIPQQASSPFPIYGFELVGSRRD